LVGYRNGSKGTVWVVKMNLVIIIICAAIFVIILPLITSVYLDIKQTQKEVQMEMKKVEALRRKVDRKEENVNSNINPN